jgi:hypothetical protein
LGHPKRIIILYNKIKYKVMANPQFKGRQKGSIKKTTLISDPLLGDYKIIVDNESYNLVYTDPGTGKEKIIGYYTQLPNALKYVVKTQTVEKKPTYTIKEYIAELKTTLNNLNTLINHE